MKRTSYSRFLARAAVTLLAVFCFLGVRAEEQTLTVYDGTTTSNYVPAYIYYFDSFTRSQFVIPATDLEELGEGAVISQITFYADQAYPASGKTPAPVVVYLKEVDYTSISAFEATENCTTVFTGTLATAGDNNLMTITFDTPYTYNGGNLLIGIENTEKSSWQNVNFYGQTVNGASVANYHSAGLSDVQATQRNFIPKTTFTYEPGSGCASPSLIANGDPTPFAFSFNIEGGSGSYNIQLKAGDAGWVPYEEEVVGPTVNLTGLTPETAYQVRVQSICEETNPETGDNLLSGWKTLSFTTPVACPAPTDMVISDITAYSANVGWTSDNENIELRYAPYVPGTDFDDSQMNGWTTIDADGDGYTWVLATQSPGVYHNSDVNVTGQGHNGSNDFILSGSYSNVYGALTPDNYLVSPQITLGGSISFWAQAQDTNYPAEHFGVAVSTTGNTDAADFTTIQEWTLTAKRTGGMLLRSSNAPRGGKRAAGTWYQYTVDLSAYSGQGYVAIRHFDCTDQFILNVDDIVIEQPGIEIPWVYVDNPANPQALTNLEPETTYTVQVRGNCGGEGTSKWLEGSFTTLPTCMAPTNLAVSNVDKRSADLAWTPNGEETAWQICINGDEENLINVTETTYSFTGLNPETTYSVKVRAYCDEQDQSHWSATATFTTLVACPAPTNLAVSDITRNSAVVSWTADGDVELQYAENVWKQYDNGVYATTMGAGGTLYWGIMLPAASLTAGEPLTKVALHTTYSGEATLNVYLGGDQPTGTPAATQTFTMAGDGDFMEIALDTPVGIDGTQNLWITFYQSGLTYSADGCTGPTDPNGRWVSTNGEEWGDIASYGYDYTWMIRAAFGDTETELVTVDNATSPQEITGLTPETSYFVRVKHICGGIDGESDWVTTNFTTDVPCSTPTALAATPYALSAKLSWVGTSDSYTVSYRQYVEGEKIVPDWQTVVVNEATAIITGLEMETQYEWKVQGDCGEYGVSEESTIATFTTTDNLCPVPTNLVADNITATTADLSWDGSPDVESFTVRYKTPEYSLFEDFESGTMPAGWTQSGPGTWEVNEGYGHNDIPAHTGTYNVKIGHSTSENETFLITPVLDLSGETDPTLSFWYINFNWAGDIDQIFVYYRVNEGEWVELWNTTEDHQQWTESGAIALPNPSNNYQVGFKMVDKYGYGVGLDDILIGSTTEWQTVSTTETNVTLTGLTPGTSYEVQVKSDCSDPEEWSAVTTFTTPEPFDITLDNNATDNSATIAAYNGKLANVTLSNRTLFKDGLWNTICLPFEVNLASSPLAGAIAKTMQTANSEITDIHVSIDFGTEDVSTLEANTPYIIKWEPADENIVNPVFPSVTIKYGSNESRTITSDDGKITFVGYYDAFQVEANDEYYYYLASDGSLKHNGNTERTLKSLRAYFNFSESITGRKFILNYGDSESTGIVEVDRQATNNDSWYGINGVKYDQQPVRKGLFIRNGRKVVIK